MRLHSLLSTLAVLPLIEANKIFYARAVSYCSENRAIEIEKFLLQYDATDSSLSFDINAASVESNLDPILTFSLTAYGIDAVNTSIAICSFFGGVLCPLPTYNFVGSATLPLPGIVTDAIDIPGIAFVIPDLEATAYVRLLREQDNSEAACLKVDLSNGKTMRHNYVSWALGAILLLSLAVSGLGGLISLIKRDDPSIIRGRTKERFLLIFGFYQFVVSTGLLSLDYPLAFLSYTANFAWTVGLLQIPSFQTHIDDLRRRTGGNLTAVDGNLVGGTAALDVNRRITALTVANTSNIARPNASLLTSLLTEAVGSSSSHSGFTKRQQIVLPEVQEQNTLDVVSDGIPRYVAWYGLSPYDAFMTVFFTFLLLLAAFIALALIITPIFILLHRRARRKAGFVEVSTGRLAFKLVRANALRILLICWFPLLLFSFFQWTIGTADAYAPIALSVFTIVPVTVALLFLAFRTLLHVRRHDETFAITAASTSPFWNPYKQKRYWFFLLPLVAIFIRALFIAFAHRSGWTQSIALLIIEVIVFLATCILLPYNDKSSIALHIIISLVRIICSAALIVFNRSIGLNEIARTVVGIVLAVIESIVIVLLFLLVLLDLFMIIFRAFRPKRPRATSEKDHGEPRLSTASDSGTLTNGNGMNHTETPEMRQKPVAV